MNTIETTDEFDALIKLRPGEPYFALLGRDPVAPEAIYDWADRHRKWARKNFHPTSARFKDEMRQAINAEEKAEELRDYRKRVIAATLDIPAVQLGDGKTYSNVSPEQRAKDAEVRKMAKLHATLNNAIAELHDQIPDLTASSGMISAEVVVLIGRMRKLSEFVKPKRPGIDT
jgi:hypothetical protein